MKNQRDLIVHYDVKPSKVYDMLTELDIARVSIKVSSFMKILNKMIVFLTKIINGYSLLNQKKIESEYDHRLKLIEALKLKFSDDPQQLLLLGNMQSDLVKFKNHGKL